MRGETVTVIRRVQIGVDAGNNPVFDEVLEDVSNVLVDSPQEANTEDVNRPHGIEADLTLRFPRSYVGGPLRGCEIIVRDSERPYTVVGDPLPLDGGLTPTMWNMSVPVTRSEG
ncbi:hypothetical protein [Bifidobacterium bifidum]|uniref:hypothetical protein n=1 Tax=Bifidobacterium bifidum TaxID=1681 RepID=UPI003D00F16D